MFASHRGVPRAGHPIVPAFARRSSLLAMDVPPPAPDIVPLPPSPHPVPPSPPTPPEIIEPPLPGSEPVRDPVVPGDMGLRHAHGARADRWYVRHAQARSASVPCGLNARPHPHPIDGTTHAG